MAVHIDWISGEEVLPQHRFLLAALPGVGNVGKLLVDGLIGGLESKLILRLLHPDMPPQANMVKGRLTPPHLALYDIALAGEHLLVITGEGQPLTPGGQFEMATTILELAATSGCELVMVLAGLASEPACEDVFAVCADDGAAEMLAAGGAEISADRPAGGVIGLAGLLASLGPVQGISSGCAVAATIGSSVDIHAAERLRLSLQKWLGLKLPIPIATTEEIADKIEALMAEHPNAQLPAEMQDDNHSSLYA